MTPVSASVLTPSLLERCRERAPQYDRDNTFCQEDFDELKAAGYLKMALPKEYGGPGFNLAQVARSDVAVCLLAFGGVPEQDVSDFMESRFVGHRGHWRHRDYPLPCVTLHVAVQQRERFLGDV